jgi:hypothetical protein
MFNISNYFFGVWSDGMIDRGAFWNLQGEVCKMSIGAVCLGSRLLGYMMMGEFLCWEVTQLLGYFVLVLLSP